MQLIPHTGLGSRRYFHHLNSVHGRGLLAPALPNLQMCESGASHALQTLSILTFFTLAQQKQISDTNLYVITSKTRSIFPVGGAGLHFNC